MRRWPFSIYLFPFLEENPSIYELPIVERLLIFPENVEKIRRLTETILIPKPNPPQIAISLDMDYPDFYFSITSALMELGIDELIVNWAYFNASRTKHIVLIYNSDTRVLKGLRTIIGQINFSGTSSISAFAQVDLRKYFEVKACTRDMPIKVDTRLSNLSLAKGLVTLSLWEFSDFVLMAAFKYIKTKLSVLAKRYTSRKPSKLALDIMTGFRTRSRSDILQVKRELQ